MRNLLRLRPPGIRVYLVALVILAVVPLLFSAVGLVVRQSALQHDAFDRSLLQTALALSVAVDRQLNSYQVMLETLAQSNELQQGHIADLHALAIRVAATHGALFISLFDHEGTQLFNTLRPFGDSLPTPFNVPVEAAPDRPPVGDPTSLKRVLESGKPVTSDLLVGLVAGRVLFTVNVPVLRDGRVAYVLNAAFTPDVMTRLLHDNAQFRGVPAVIFDRRGFIVGRWQDADTYVGRRIFAYDIHHDVSRDTYVGVGRTLEGLKVNFSYARSKTTGWGVYVGADRLAMESAVRRTWVLSSLLAVGGLALGMYLALALAARLRRSISALADSAGHAPRPSRPGLRTREFARLEQMLGEAAAARESEARERESRLVAEARKMEVEHAIRLRDEFIAVMSHELRNPLAPIRNGVALIRTMRARGDDRSVDAVVDILDRQSEQLVRLVNDLLDMSRIQLGRMTLQRQRLDLRAVARHAIETLQPAIDARRHRLASDNPADPVEVMGDFARLSQVLTNLLDNAVRYTPDGGDIRLIIGTERDHGVVRVQDNGRGMDATAWSQAFTAFGQVDGRAGGNGGLGLGLPLAKALVELHGGTIEGRSPGTHQGSEFTVRIPLAPPEAPSGSGPAARPTAMPQAPPRRILIVDDNIDAAMTLKWLVESLGHTTHVEHDGEGALAAAAEFRPEVVLLDIGLPGMDGYELARRLRVAFNGPLRLVAVTGWGQATDKAKAAAAGFDVHVVKPLAAEQLARVLADARHP